MSMLTNSAAEYGMAMFLTSANGGIVFNEPLEAEFVGYLSPESSGLDSPEIREDSAEKVEDDGAILAPFFAGKRPIVLTGTIIASSITDRNEKMAKIENVAFGLLRTGGFLSYKPQGASESILIEVRLQQPIRFTEGYVKKFQLALVAGDPRKFGSTKTTTTAGTGTPSGGFATPSTTAASGADGGGGSNTWQNPTRITAEDSSFSTVTGNAGTTSNPLLAKEFKHAVPAGATITGIEFLVRRKTVGSGTIETITFKPLKAGVAAGTNQGPETWTEPVTTKVFGGNGNLMGTTWTPAQVNEAGFGCEIAVKNSALLTPEAEIDAIKSVVYYTVPPVIATINNTGTWKAPLQVKVVGPVSGAFELKNKTTGKVIKFKEMPTLAIGSGHYIIVDFGNKTVTIDGTTDEYSKYIFSESEWWELQPGNNELELPNGSEVITTWKNTWM